MVSFDDIALSVHLIEFKQLNNLYISIEAYNTNSTTKLLINSELWIELRMIKSVND